MRQVARALVPLADQCGGGTPAFRRLRELRFDGVLLERSDAEQTWLFTRTVAQAEAADRLLRTPG